MAKKVPTSRPPDLKREPFATHWEKEELAFGKKDLFDRVIESHAKKENLDLPEKSALKEKYVLQVKFGSKEKSV